MKRSELLKKLRRKAKEAGLSYDETELKNHTGIKIGHTKSVVPRHNEIADGTARAIFDQFANEFGKGWWR